VPAAAQTGLAPASPATSLPAVPAAVAPVPATRAERR
jgi:hypothetical protein